MEELIYKGEFFWCFFEVLKYLYTFIHVECLVYLHAVTTILHQLLPEADSESKIHVQGVTEKVLPGETRKGVEMQEGEEVNKGIILGQVAGPARSHWQF